MGHSGGTLAFWQSGGCSVEVVHVGRQAFATIIKEGECQPWVFAGAYASMNCVIRRERWNASGQLMSRDLPVCFIGGV